MGALALFPLIAAGCGGDGADETDDSFPPNIVLISIDSLRADHLGCYGYERDTSPTIDRLASEGVRFERAISQAPWTLPSHASLFTGLYGRTHQTDDLVKRLPDGIPTIASELSDYGYNTRGIVSGTFMQKRFGLDSGFDEYDDELAQVNHKRSHETITSPVIHGKATAMLENLSPPFFLFLHYWDVHYDFAPPAPHDTRFDLDYAGNITSKRFMKNERINVDMPRADLEHLVALYDGEISWVDAHIERLLAVLDEQGFTENTVIILTADHGDEFFEHGAKGHSHSLYDELLHVPLIVRGPGVKAGATVPQAVELVDVLPTVMDLTRTDTPAGAQGRSLIGALRGEPLAPEPVFSQTTRARKDKDAEWTDAWSVESELRKWTTFTEAGVPNELYDIATDPGETTSLGSDDAELSALLEDWRKRVPKGETVLNSGVDAATMRRLEALGYTGGRAKKPEGGK